MVYGQYVRDSVQNPNNSRGSRCPIGEASNFDRGFRLVGDMPEKGQSISEYGDTETALTLRCKHPPHSTSLFGDFLTRWITIFDLFLVLEEKG